MPISLKQLKDIILEEEQKRTTNKDHSLLLAILKDIDDIILYVNIAKHKGHPPDVILDNIHHNLSNISKLLNQYATIRAALNIND